MPSTNKTQNLQLNQWIETDKPTRADFVSDNSIIDSVVSGHVSDSNLHLSVSEKQRVSAPYVIKLFQGTGESSRSINMAQSQNKTDFIPKLEV